MQMRQAVAFALMAFASTARCEDSPFGPDGCGDDPSSAVASTPAVTSSAAPESTTAAASSSAVDMPGTLISFSYTEAPGQSAGPATSVAETPVASSSAAATTVDASSSAVPTTFVTSTQSQTTTTAGNMDPPASSSAPVSEPTGSPSPGAGLTGPCDKDKEGMYNCVGGSQYQQCAAGQWSKLQPLAPGTHCKEGQSLTLWRRRKSTDTELDFKPPGGPYAGPCPARGFRCFGGGSSYQFCQNDGTWSDVGGTPANKECMDGVGLWTLDGHDIP